MKFKKKGAKPSKKKMDEFVSKILRIWKILNILDKGGRVYVDKISQELNVSKRTIQRDIKIIGYAGFRVEGCDENPGAYKFIEGYRLGKVMITKEEASIITLLCDMTEGLDDKFSETIKGLREKMVIVADESPFYLKAAPTVNIPPEISYFAGKAISEHKKAAIVYDSHKGKEERTVDPYKICGYEGFLYLMAKEQGKKGFSKFRMDKLKMVQVLNEKSAPIGNELKTKLDESMNIWFDGGKPFDVELCVDKRVAEYFMAQKYFPEQKVVKKKSDGTLVLKSTVSHQMEVIPEVLKWIPHVRVIKPRKVKDEIERRIEEYGKRKEAL